MSVAIVSCAADLRAKGCPDGLCETAWEKIISEQFDAGEYVLFGERCCDSESDSEDSYSAGRMIDGDPSYAHADLKSVVVAIETEESLKNEVLEVTGDEVSAPTMYSLHAKSDMPAYSTILLVDHMWTTTFPQTRLQLKELPQLRQRLGAALGIPWDDGESEQLHIEAVWRAMWPHLICTSAAPDAYTSWACLDEVGIALTHSASPNMTILPVAAVVKTADGRVGTQQVTLVWPITDIEEGEMLTRDYLQSVRLPHNPVVAKGETAGEEAGSGGDLSVAQRQRLCSELFTSLQSIGLALPSHLSKELVESTTADGKDVDTAKGHSEAKFSSGAVSRVLQESFDNLVRPLFDLSADTKRFSSRTIAAADLFQLADFKSTARCSSEIPTELRKQAVHPKWLSSLNKLKHIRDNGQPLKIYMDKQVYLWGQLQGPRGSFDEACVRPEDPSTRCPVVLVDSPEEADVLYLIDHTYTDPAGHDCEHYKSNKILNQFWWEGLLVSKNMLARTLNRYFEVYCMGEEANANQIMDSSRLPIWFPPSYDLDVPVEMWAFINDFINRSGDNYWILKRIIGRMSVDYPVTNSLQCCLRHCEGPLRAPPTDGESVERVSRVASKYVLHPTTFRGRKFDIRFYLVVTSLYPLKLQRHEAFVIRLSNDVYSPDNFEDFQKHFTLMSLLDDEEMKSIRQPGSRTNVVYTEWIKEFDAELKASGRMQTAMGGCQPALSSEEPSVVQWETHVMPRMHHAVTSVFKAAQAAALQESPPGGGGVEMNAGWSLNQPNDCPAMAVYGVDILLDSDLNPVILEIQWSPDAEKACLYVPTFWQDMMRALYLGGTTNMLTLCDEQL